MKRRTLRTPKKERKRSAVDWAPRFLEQLALRGNILRACEVAKIGRSTFYDRRDADDDFAAKVREAKTIATDRLEDEARRRGEDGVSKPVLYKGKPIFLWFDKDNNVLPSKKGSVGPRRALMEHEYSDTLLIFLLNGLRPNKYRSRQRIEHTGKGGKPIEYKDVSDGDLDRKIAEAEARLRSAANGKTEKAAEPGTGIPLPA